MKKLQWHQELSTVSRNLNIDDDGTQSIFVVACNRFLSMLREKPCELMRIRANFWVFFTRHDSTDNEEGYLEGLAYN